MRSSRTFWAIFSIVVLFTVINQFGLVQRAIKYLKMKEAEPGVFHLSIEGNLSPLSLEEASVLVDKLRSVGHTDNTAIKVSSNFKRTQKNSSLVTEKPSEIDQPTLQSEIITPGQNGQPAVTTPVNPSIDFNTTQSNANVSTENPELELLSYPLVLENASALVEELLAGKPVNITPINMNYVSVSFPPEYVKRCKVGEAYDILMAIKTRVRNFEDRMQIRKTWASKHFQSKFRLSFKYVFILGKSKSRKRNDAIIKEMKHYNDIVIADFVDTYGNITYKTMLGMRWAVEFCPNFKLYVSFDDDTYLSFPNMVKFLQNPYAYPESTFSEFHFETVLKPWEHFYSGFKNEEKALSPIRDNSSKYYLSHENYPPTYFPAYIVGYFIAMSPKTVHSFYHLSRFVKHVAIDDVYLGILANKLQIDPFDTSKFTPYKLSEVIKLENPEDVRETLRNHIAIHYVLPIKKRTLIWETLHFKYIT